MSVMSTESEPAVLVANVSKSFKTIVKPPGFLSSIQSLFHRNYQTINALQGIRLTIGSGEILGLIGENGAGKTTLLKILSGIFPPDSGEVRCLGFTPSDRDPDYLKRISLLSGARTQLWWDLTPSDSFALLASIYSLDRTFSDWSFHLAERLNVHRKLDVQLRRLSLGERMKMEIIGALLHKPQLIFFDEPTLGLDLQSQQEIRRFIKEYVTSFGATAIITSHYMKDIEEICDRIVFLFRGKIHFSGTVDDILKRFERQVKIQCKKIARKDHSVQEDHTIITTEQDIDKTIQEVHELGLEVVSIEVEDFTSIMSRFFEAASQSQDEAER